MKHDGSERPLLSVSAILGFLSFTAAGACTIVWWAGQFEWARETSYLVATQSWQHLGVQRIVAIAGVAAVLGAVVWLTSGRELRNVRIVLAIWPILFAVAALYGNSLPRSHPFGDAFPGSSGGIQVLWPILALGLQVLSLGGYWTVASLRLVEPRKFRRMWVPVFWLGVTGAGAFLTWYGLVRRPEIL